MGLIDRLRGLLAGGEDQAPAVLRGPSPSQVGGGFTITLDYSVNSKPRYPIGQRPHPKLQAILSRGKERYRAQLESFLPFVDFLAQIPAAREPGDVGPHWINGFIPGMDGVSIYGMIATRRPKQYFEIGSGNSTKFARQAIRDHVLSTRIVSIDPSPRAEIDQLCEETLRLPLEDCDLSLFDRLGEGDILFVDNSHRCFMGSDVTVFFLDILPNLKKGVIVGIHDIALPFDYPAEWVDRYYSEQYLLACWLLAETRKFEVLLPSAYASVESVLDASLGGLLDGLWSRLSPEVEKHGSIFWLEIAE